MSCHPRNPGQGSYQNYVVYGDDNRFPMEEYAEYLDNSMATAVKLLPQAIYHLPPELYTEKKLLISWNSFEAVYDPEDSSWARKPVKICSDEPFRGEVMAGTCSGVLIAPDMVLTAGHCMEDQADCLSSYWAFDYRQENSIGSLGLTFEGSKADPESIIMIKQSNLFSCERILARQSSADDNDPERLDFALIQLNNYVYDRAPQPLRKQGVAQEDQALILLGYPLGLPGKIALDAKIIDNNSQNFFLTSSDSYYGNSGSAVIDDQTKLLEGILTDGAEDFIYDPAAGCMRSRVLSALQGEERVTRISSILEYIRANAEYGPELVDYILSH